MKKSIYIIMAIVIAAGLTAVQALIADSIVKRNEMEVCVALNDIDEGSIVFESDIELIKIYKGNYDRQLGAAIPGDILGKSATHDISTGDIVYMSDVDAEPGQDVDSGFVALEVSGENFNAGDLETGDFIDLYMIPDFSKITDEHIVWLNSIFSEVNVRFIPGRQPGILLENLLISYIDTATGQSAKYVSVRVPRPLDEAIAFLEQHSVFEFIGR